MKPPEMTKTVMDMEAPRFDVGGDKITGEYDSVKTPELEIVDVSDLDDYESIEVTALHPLDTDQRCEFVIGVTIGLLVGAAAFAAYWLVN